MIYQGRFSELETHLFASIEEIKRDDPLAPVVVLAGSNLARLYLQRRLAEDRSSHLNVRFLTFMDLARFLTEPDFLAAGARPLSPEGQLALCRRLVKGLDAADYFQPLSEFPGFPRALAATFTDIEEAGLSSLPVAGGAPPKLASLASLYAAYRRSLTGRFYTGAELLTASAERASRYPALFGTDRLLVYGIYDLNPAQRALLASLLTACRISFFVPAGYGPLEADIAVFAREAGLTEAGNMGPARLDETSLPPVEFISAPDPEAEVRETLRRIMDFAERGGNFSDVGILLRDSSQAELYAAYMDRLGIPYFSSFGRTLACSPEARSFLMFLDIVASDMERFAVMEFLDYAPLDRRALEKAGHAYTPGLWDLISRQAGIVKGMDQWKRGLAREEAALERRAARDPENSEVAERRAAAGGLRYVLGILRRAASRLSAQAPWGVWVDALGEAVRSLLAPAASREVLLESLAELRALDALEPQATLAEVGQTLRDLWGRTGEAAGRFQSSGVNLCDLMAARGLSFKLTVLPSLVSGVFPRVPRQDPLLLDGERRAINEELGREALVPKGIDRGEEALLFRLALDSAGERLVLSYPRAEGAGQRERVPSPFLLEVAKALTGETKGYRDLETAPGFLRVPARPAPAAGLAKALSPSEFDRCLALESARRGERPEGWAREGLSPFWAGRIAAEAADRANHLGPYHLVPGVPVPGVGASHPVGATRLELYARCPYRFFLQDVLGLEPLEEPEAALSISPLDRGKLMHAILASLYRELAADGLLPLDGKNLERCMARLAGHIEAELARRGEELITGLPLLWSLEREKLERELRAYLAREAKAGEGMIPLYFELTFGSDAEGDTQLPPAELVLPGGTALAFRGRIDRVDASANGRSLRVIDYKGGRTTHRPESLEGGEQLQLALYLLAALNLPEGEGAEELQARYVYLNERAGRREASFTPRSVSTLRSELASLLETITDLMRQGYYFLHPVENRCKSCDYHPACPPERSSLFNRKRDDALVAVFRGLRHG